MADQGGTQYVTGNTGAANVAVLNALGVSPEWQWGVSARYQVNTQFAVWAGYTETDFTDSGRFGLGVNWNPVSGLSIRPEAVFGDNYTQARLTVVRSF
jgi:hypothetical protein